MGTRQVQGVVEIQAFRFPHWGDSWRLLITLTCPARPWHTLAPLHLCDYLVTLLCPSCSTLYTCPTWLFGDLSASLLRSTFHRYHVLYLHWMLCQSLTLNNYLIFLLSCLLFRSFTKSYALTDQEHVSHAARHIPGA